MAGNLFTFPRPIAFDVGVVQPGAKLTFTLTGTTTPQNTYTDIDLTTPHANPVVANSEGLFAPIYMDPSFDDYRVLYTDSADVLIYQDDDIPASQSGQSLTLTDAAPFIDLIESDASANNGVWRIAVNGEQLTLKLGNDALSSFTDILTIDRTANVADAIDLTVTALTQNTNTVAIATSGSFTGTLTGCTTTPTATVNWEKTGNHIMLRFGTQLTATSNAATLTVTGLPSAIQPTSNQRMVVTNLVDSGATALGGFCTIGPVSVGVLTFNRMNVSGSNITSGTWTASGVKGIGSSCVIHYDLG